MNEHPILFSGPMVRAILEGRKTQTRRVVNPQPHNVEGMLFWKRGAKVYGLPEQGELSTVLLGIWDACPYGQPGDLLWVRETFTTYPAFDGLGSTEVIYRENPIFDGMSSGHGDFAWRWTPPIHMPRRLSRLTLRITEVRVQRVQEISPDDCWDEGSDGGKMPGTQYTRIEIKHVFADLWDSINAKRGYSWESNPWVWAITFKRET